MEPYDPVRIHQQLSDYEDNTQKQLAQMPFDLGDRSARPAPRCRLALGVLAEALVLGPRGSCHWPRQPMGDLLAQDDVGRQTDGVKEPGFLQPLMGRRDRLVPVFGPPRLYQTGGKLYWGRIISGSDYSHIYFWF